MTTTLQLATGLNGVLGSHGSVATLPMAFDL